ncbi:hypothetical protein L596_008131 [Steinernema carpocapsae]|uniref:Uncharacterized protein n=1 Tax=Steinernema carpocapsae TaxID=34508 RepID=A0A4V6A674_STECR|nr:hypothetical protein L596_008131 [Steinernema carpocapsae]
MRFSYRSAIYLFGPSYVIRFPIASIPIFIVTFTIAICAQKKKRKNENSHRSARGARTLASPGTPGESDERPSRRGNNVERTVHIEMYGKKSEGDTTFVHDSTNEINATQDTRAEEEKKTMNTQLTSDFTMNTTQTEGDEGNRQTVEGTKEGRKAKMRKTSKGNGSENSVFYFPCNQPFLLHITFNLSVSYLSISLANLKTAVLDRRSVEDGRFLRRQDEKEVGYRERIVENRAKLPLPPKQKSKPSEFLLIT